MTTQITRHSIEAFGSKVFVREAGDRTAPAIVLLHGYPSSSHMFRELIPLLAGRFRVIAPDMIGYGGSDAPSVDAFDYTFDNLTAVTRKVLEHLEVASYVLYLHDFGGPVGLRLAAAEPHRVRGLIVQNANAYMEGISEVFANLFQPLWKERNEKTLAAARGFLSAEITKMQYTAGARDTVRLDPAAWMLDQAFLDRPGIAEAQIALFIDYEKNVASYDAWHAYFRAHQPKTLVVWGKNDPFFLQAGAEAFRRDLPDAEIVLLDGGHFALEEHAPAVAAHIGRVFGQRTEAETVRSFYDELGAGRLDEALRLLATDVSWNDPKGFPYGGNLVGAAAVKERVFARIAADWPTFAITIDKLVASNDGADVVAIGAYTGRHGATGRALHAPFAHTWSVSRGVITRFETFTDTAAMRDAMTA
ncbi:alpha/beta fold hydrolase [Pendulispora albinea]|uniref:Alpha/beta fold hydrolase n=1 Tax=Pendulispora albinea TaxID=2741071 RepID=A0ABZ2MAB3_9BACT